MRAMNLFMVMFCAWRASIHLRGADAHVKAYEAWIARAKEFEARS